MMVKKFRAAPRAQDTEPLDDFEISWTDRDGDEKTEQFSLFEPAGSVQLLTITAVAGLRHMDSNETRASAVAAAINYLGGCMESGEYDRFREILLSPGLGMEEDELTDLCRWAVETVTGRPTKPSTGSRGGRTPSGRRSTAVARSKA